MKPILRISSTLFFILSILIACNDQHQNEITSKALDGSWELTFNIGEVEIPVRMSIENSVWIIHNASEKIVLDSVLLSGKNFHVQLPLFNTTFDGELLDANNMKGYWTDHSRDSIYTIPFAAHRKPRETNAPLSVLHTTIYEATFSQRNIEATYKALGVFDYCNNNVVTGTFLTETGDYRFLEGNSTGQSVHLSSFNGAHLFYFCANIEGDSLTDGKFYSGTHWSEDWEARLNPLAKLRDADSLTFLKNPYDEFNFSVCDLNGDSIEFDISDFAGKVTIVQILGSWCPNCMDESNFLLQLYNKWGAQGLQIIPVAFERGDDFELSKRTVTNQFDQLHLPYPPYFGGSASKACASQVFSHLSQIISYPTAIFIDKKGKIRKIHTGFYGPGTKDYYARHTEMIELFVAQLLAE